MKKKLDNRTLSKALQEAVSLLVLNTDLYSSYASARQSILNKVRKNMQNKKT